MVDAEADLGLSADVLLQLYQRGWFPMVEDDGVIHIHRPVRRAVFELSSLKPDTTTARHLRTGRFTITVNRCFEEVMRRCADRAETWIDDRMIDAYTELHRQGHAHSVEAWSEGKLVGGIYGVALGAAFFGESLFGVNNAGKAAFFALAAELRSARFMLFDSQYINPFTRSLGAFEISATDFDRRLKDAQASNARFPCEP